VLPYAVTVVLGYLLGSIPTGFLVAKARGVDIRKVGSGNIGATNVFRILGKPAGMFVFLTDAVKGWVAVAVVAKLVAIRLFASPPPAGSEEWMAILAGISAVLGHNYTCWLHFKGGKGIATSAGVLMALVPWALLIILSIWVLVLAFTRYVSLASICASAALPPAAWLTTNSPRLTAITGLMGALAIYKHKANIKRLLNGTENRIGPRKDAAPQSTRLN
jgi:glycerol-3-phosphate acyltransferase PlsY